MGVQNFTNRSGILGQRQKLRKAGRLTLFGLGALVLLPMGQANAGQCTAGQNFAPGTSTRQPNWDFLCAGADLLTDSFQRLLDRDLEDVWPMGTEKPDELTVLNQDLSKVGADYIASLNSEGIFKDQIKSINEQQDDLSYKMSEIAGKQEKLAGEASELNEIIAKANIDIDLWSNLALNAQENNDEQSIVYKKNSSKYIEIKAKAESDLKQNAAAAQALKADEDKIKSAQDANKAKIAKLQNELNAAEAKSGKLNEQRTALQQQISEVQKRQNQQQSVAGLPPDATIIDQLQRLSWWADGGVTHNDQWSGPTRSRTTSLSGMIGADMPVNDNTTLGFGIGFGHSTVTQDTAFAGTTDSETLNLLLKLDWEATGNVSFDMNAAYGISSSHRAAASGYTDDYLVSNIGLGIGISSFLDLDDDWRVSGRLGWSGSINTRYASTDSTNVAQGENSNAFSQAQLSTKIEKGLPAIDGSIFADGKLNAVLVDESLMDATSSPFTLEIGAGMESQLSDAVSFNARGFVGSIGRSDQTTFGGTLGFKMSF